MEQGLMDDKDGIVDHDSHQDDKPQKSQHIQGLEGYQVEQGQPHHAAGGGQRHRQQDDEGVEEAFEQHRHH